jgi:predicted nucleic acid-binding protein
MHRAPARPARIVVDANVLVSAVIASGHAALLTLAAGLA